MFNKMKNKMEQLCKDKEEIYINTNYRRIHYIKNGRFNLKDDEIKFLNEEWLKTQSVESLNENEIIWRMANG